MRVEAEARGELVLLEQSRVHVVDCDGVGSSQQVQEDTTGGRQSLMWDVGVGALLLYDIFHFSWRPGGISKSHRG